MMIPKYSLPDDFHQQMHVPGYLRIKDHHGLIQAAYPTYTVFATMLYGSQNYGLHTVDSDVDSKVIILPPFGDFALRQKWFSEEVNLVSGLSAVKDVRAMFENFLKFNINFLECLFAEAVVINPDYAAYWKELQHRRDFLANAHPRKLLHAAAGMAKQKYAALEKPYPSKTDVIRDYGYDPKQLHHLCRLRFFMLRFLRSRDFASSLKPNEQEHRWLMQVKTEPMPLEEARKEAEFAMTGIDNLINEHVNKLDKDPYEAHECKEFYHELSIRLLRDHLYKELSSGKELNLES
jgi:hypothetical protein